MTLMSPIYFEQVDYLTFVEREYLHVAKQRIGGTVHATRRGWQSSECGMLRQGRREEDEHWLIVKRPVTCKRCLARIARETPKREELREITVLVYRR